jgi:hypothetical protein
MLQLIVVYWCCLGIVDIVISCADALCGGLSTFNLVTLHYLSCESYTRIFPLTFWDHFGLKCGELDV